MTPEGAVLEQAPTLDGLTAFGADRAADMVDDTEACTPDDRRIGHVVRKAFGEVVALPHSMQPVRVPAVPAADRRPLIPLAFAEPLAEGTPFLPSDTWERGNSSSRRERRISCRRKNTKLMAR